MNFSFYCKKCGATIITNQDGTNWLIPVCPCSLQTITLTYFDIKQIPPFTLPVYEESEL